MSVLMAQHNGGKTADDNGDPTAKLAVSQRITLLRVANHLTQTEAAALIEERQSTWAQWESTHTNRMPTADQRRKLQEIYGVPPEWIMAGVASRLPSWLTEKLLQAEMGVMAHMKARRKL